MRSAAETSKAMRGKAMRWVPDLHHEGLVELRTVLIVDRQRWVCGATRCAELRSKDTRGVGTRRCHQLHHEGLLMVGTVLNRGTDKRWGCGATHGSAPLGVAGSGVVWDLHPRDAQDIRQPAQSAQTQTCRIWVSKCRDLQTVQRLGRCAPRHQPRCARHQQSVDNSPPTEAAPNA